jgi:DNA-binding MurR/RpiR family transcriptional regulator
MSGMRMQDSGAMKSLQYDAADPFRRRVAAVRQTLAPAGRRVVQFIDQNRLAVLANSAAELAASIGTSDATVVRTVQALGFAGLDDLRRTLIAGMGDQSRAVDGLRRTLAEVGPDAAHAIDVVLETHREALATLQSADTRARIAAAAQALNQVQRINVFGIGPTAALAHYAAVLLARTGRRARALDATGLTLADQMLDLHAGDGLLVMAYTQPYREVTALFHEARRLSLPAVLITDSRDNRLAQLAGMILPVPRGRADRVALHGATFVALEALILALAASAPDAAMTALERLNDLRASVTGKRTDVG